MSKVALLFPGQGAQSVGMGMGLYHEVPEARELYDRASNLLGFDLPKASFEGPAEFLEQTNISQPAIFVASLAALAGLRAERPELVESAAGAAGLSLGEYTALVFAGAMDFETGLRIVKLRGEAMQSAARATPSGMSSVLGLDVDKVDELCERVRDLGRLWKANLLGPGNIVVSGDLAALEALEPIATSLGAMKVVPLAVAGAFHTPLMQPADRQLAEVLAAAEINNPRIPVYSNVTSLPHTHDPDAIRHVLAAQVTSGVRWEESVRRMIADGFTEFHEIGPGRVLTSLMKRIDRKIPCTNIPAR
jgi:[acyl-carrier-protein] S-malonyltransferase